MIAPLMYMSDCSLAMLRHGSHFVDSNDINLPFQVLACNADV